MASSSKKINIERHITPLKVRQQETDMLLRQEEEKLRKIKRRIAGESSCGVVPKTLIKELGMQEEHLAGLRNTKEYLGRVISKLTSMGNNASIAHILNDVDRDLSRMKSAHGLESIDEMMQRIDNKLVPKEDNDDVLDDASLLLKFQQLAGPPK